MQGLERFRGPVLRPGQPCYDEERAGFNLAGLHRPAVVAGATCAADVVEAVRWAGARGLPVAVQATGHGLRDCLEDGVLITTQRMRGLTIDAASRTARVEAGVRSGDLVAAAAEHGLAPRNGSSPAVGVVGYTLAGGLGLLGRGLGWAADHVRWMDVVTPDGRLRRVTAVTEPGVVTAMEIELVPLTTVYGGALTFDSAHAATVLQTWLEWTRTAPCEATSSVAMVTMPGFSVVSIRLAVLGGEAAGLRLAAPLRAAAPVVADTLRVLPWSESASITSDPAAPHPYQGTGVLLRCVDGEALRQILAAAAGGIVVQLNHLGGALAEGATGTAHRDANYLLRLLSVVRRAGPAPITHAHEAVVTALGPRVLGRSLAFQFGCAR